MRSRGERIYSRRPAVATTVRGENVPRLRPSMGNLRERRYAEPPDDDKRDPQSVAMPRYWVVASEVGAAAPGWHNEWLLAFHKIARTTDERTLIAAVIPESGAGDSAPVAFVMSASRACALIAVWTSFVCDYVARQKVGGTNMSFAYLYQFACPAPEALDASFVTPRVLEVTYTASNLAPLPATSATTASRSAGTRSGARSSAPSSTRSCFGHMESSAMTSTTC